MTSRFINNNNNNNIIIISRSIVVPATENRGQPYHTVNSS